MVNYKSNDPGGWCGDMSRGAALGRNDFHTDSGAMLKFYLKKIRLDDGGYDSNGTYFGVGQDLYWYADEDENVDAMLRANDRNDAKRQVIDKYPNARFYR